MPERARSHSSGTRPLPGSPRYGRLIALLLGLSIATWVVGACSDATSGQVRGEVRSVPREAAHYRVLQVADGAAQAPSPTDVQERDGVGPSQARVAAREVVRAVAPPPRPRLSDARVEQLQGELDEILNDESVRGRQLSALVVEAESRRVLYEADPDLLLVPASNTKLFTTAAALALLGEDYRFESAVYAGGTIDGDGVLEGDLTLVVEHDFTWSPLFYPSARFPLDQLADALFREGLRRVRGTVRLAGEVVYDGYHFGELDVAEHRQEGVRRFAQALEARGIAVGETDTAESFEPPPDASRLAEWRSVPLSVACSPINRLSHNEFADALMRHLGYVIGGESSGEAGALVVADWLRGLGVTTDGFSLHDGSGLSYDNRVSARQIVQLMQAMAAHPAGLTWFRSLAVGGVRGTLRNRLADPDTRGRVSAKTGTLEVAIATSGRLVNRHDGRRYLFALLMNEQPSQSAARAVQDRVIEALAADLFEAGQRPAAPELEVVQGGRDGAAVEVLWQPVEGASGYLIWRSADGRLWDRGQAEFVAGSANRMAHRLSGLEPGQHVFVRITAVSEAGESDPSDVYAAGLGEGAAAILIVDGNQRWQREPVEENPLGGGHDFLRQYADAIAGPAFDSVSNVAVADGVVSLQDYQLVIWATAEDSEEDASFDVSERALLAHYTAAGGDLFVSGSEIGWDLCSDEASRAADFYRDTLHATYLGDDAGTFLVRGSGGLFEDLPLMSFHTPDAMVVEYPDRLAPQGGSVGVMTYEGGEGGTAALVFDGDYRLLYLGFPFESIDNRVDRAAVMGAALTFFGL